ncbi:MAG: hypothetical protein M1834_005023 [Cirrosporium novae-zelandiae]|nr:MAG: hypothetical protein M1834_005023 [Cirrosporium novae-zelandiae]
MLPTLRTRGASSLLLLRGFYSSPSPLIRAYSTPPTPTKAPAGGADPSADHIPTNDPAPKPQVQNVSATNQLPTSPMGSMDSSIQEGVEEAEEKRVAQAPNRKGIWSRSQQPREKAMTGPRFEQTMMEFQPRPHAAIELIHKQPVRWVDTRMVSCDGGGGPLGHPKIFINVDKPQICWCTYCGIPFAHSHHRHEIESKPHLHTYPLDPTGHEAEVEESQRVTDEPFGQR